MLIEVGEHVKVLNVTRHDETPGSENRQTCVVVRPEQVVIATRWENDSLRLMTATHVVHVKATAEALDRIVYCMRDRMCESVDDSRKQFGVTP
jgi:hypothetical protein